MKIKSIVLSILIASASSVNADIVIESPANLSKKAGVGTISFLSSIDNTPHGVFVDGKEVKGNIYPSTPRENDMHGATIKFNYGLLGSGWHDIIIANRYENEYAAFSVSSHSESFISDISIKNSYAIGEKVVALYNDSENSYASVGSFDTGKQRIAYNQIITINDIDIKYNEDIASIVFDYAGCNEQDSKYSYPLSRAALRSAIDIKSGGTNGQIGSDGSLPRDLAKYAGYKGGDVVMISLSSIDDLTWSQKRMICSNGVTDAGAASVYDPDTGGDIITIFIGKN